MTFRSLLLDYAKQCFQSGARRLALGSAFLPLALISATPALAQQTTDPAKPATVQATPRIAQPQQPVTRAPRKAQQKLKPEPEAIPAAAAASTPAIAPSPQPADGRLPFTVGNEEDSHAQPASATGLLLRTLGALLLIVGLIVAAAWGLKRFGGARFGKPQENAPALAVLNSLSLGERRSLTIVRFGDRTLLLGATPQSVTLLAEAEADDFTPQARSVADILNDEKPAAFDEVLISATAQLDKQIQTLRRTGSTS